MSEKKTRVPVYDTKSSKFQTVRQSEIENGDDTIILPILAKKLTSLVEKFEVLNVPRFGKFDLYESNSSDPGENSHSIVSNSRNPPLGNTLCARLDYGGLGHTSSVKRVFSKQYRLLRVGVLP
jgi:V8-like Glu-specific endopeptidase